MKYVRKEDYVKGDFSHLIEASTIEELEAQIMPCKGYGVDVCPDERADGILIIQK